MEPSIKYEVFHDFCLATNKTRSSCYNTSLDNNSFYVGAYVQEEEGTVCAKVVAVGVVEVELVPIQRLQNLQLQRQLCSM
jgi:hypothetical protein